MYLLLKFTAALCFLNTSFAGVRTANQIKSELKEGVFVASVKDGFHINEKAPNGAMIDGLAVKPSSLSTREAKFTGLPNFKNGLATLYVCDDAVTFCETSVIDMKTGTETLPVVKAAQPKKKTKTKKAEKTTAEPNLPNAHGFLEDQYDLALAQATRENKLVLVDFSARWCPGCVRLEMETFPTEEFKKMTGAFVKVKVDVDRFENTVLTEKFKITGIPTLMVLTTGQEEVGRVVDYQPHDRLRQFFDSVTADPAPLRELKEKARGKDQATLLRLGRRMLAAGRAQEAVDAFEQIKPPPHELLDARVENSPKDIKVLREAIAADPASPRSIEWRATLAGLTERYDEKAKLKEDGVKIADDLLANPEKLKESLMNEDTGEFRGVEMMMVAMLRAELIEASGAPAGEILAAWKKTAQVGTSLNIPTKNVGASMRHLIFLTEAKEYQQADKLALRLIKNDPKNAELQRRRLRLLFELKNFDEAVKLGQKVIKESYGRNEFWAAETTAKSFAQTSKRKEAREFIERYLARPEMNWPNLKATRKTLEDLKAKLQQQGSMNVD